MPRTMGSEYRHRVICIDVTVMSHFTHLNMRFTGFLALFMRSWYPTIIPKRGCALYTKLRSIHHFKGLDKGCVLYTGASYTREITVMEFCFYSFRHLVLLIWMETTNQGLSQDLETGYPNLVKFWASYLSWETTIDYNNCLHYRP